MKIRIDIKEDHIINGVCLDPSENMIAIAINDFLEKPHVYERGIFINGCCLSGKEICKSLPIDVQSKILEFDKCDAHVIYHPAQGKDRLKYVQPFSFEIDIDSNVVFPNLSMSDIQNKIESSESVSLVNN